MAKNKKTIHLIRYTTYNHNKTWCGRPLKYLSWTFRPSECTCKSCLRAAKAYKPRVRIVLSAPPRKARRR